VAEAIVEHRVGTRLVAKHKQQHGKQQDPTHRVARLVACDNHTHHGKDQDGDRGTMLETVTTSTTAAGGHPRDLPTTRTGRRLGRLE